MTQRKSLSKKVRFQVFGRDNFTCMYCGAKAPDVILEVDHIHPVSKGGINELMNLITSCYDCNRGKAARIVNDKSIVEKQRQQIEELNIRRQQLEMMLEWRDGLKNQNTVEVNKAVDYFNKLWDGVWLSKSGQEEIIKLVKKFTLISVLDAIDIAYSKYNNGDTEYDRFNNVFKKIGGILYLNTQSESVKKISYIKGICRNRFNYFNEKAAKEMLDEYFSKFDDYDDCIAYAKTCKNYSQWYNGMVEFMNGKSN